MDEHEYDPTIDKVLADLLAPEDKRDLGNELADMLSATPPDKETSIVAILAHKMAMGMLTTMLGTGVIEGPEPAKEMVQAGSLIGALSRKSDESTMAVAHRVVKSLLVDPEVMRTAMTKTALDNVRKGKYVVTGGGK